MATTCTIDYLATAQPHKRSMSLRHHSLLSFGNRGNTDSRSDLGSNRLASFLRRLFNRREPRQLQRRHEAVSRSQRWASLTRDEHNDRSQWSGRPLSQEIVNRLANSNSTACQTEHQPFAPNKSISASPSLSSQLSGSNSLIEILDCSPDLARTKRTLRRERTDGKLRPNRAQSWRLVIRRTDSESSQQSKSGRLDSNDLRSSLQSPNYTETPAIPEKELTKELREQDKDFMDSINVLRQASRHAILSSRSSSKGSEMEPIDQVLSTSEPVSPASPPQDRLPTSPDTTIPMADKQASPELPPMNSHHDLNGDPQKLTDCCLCSAYASGQQPHISTGCPLAYCPPPLPCYCFRQLGELASNPMSCPLWCSMLCPLPYPLPIYGSPSPLAMAPPLAHTTMPNLSPSQLTQNQHQQHTPGVDLLETANYSSSSRKQQQKQQHNTTIDLKIEIGADFKAQLARAASLERGRNRSTLHLRKSEVKRLDDSCDEQSDSMTRSDGRSSDNQQLSSLTSNQSEGIEDDQDVDYDDDDHGYDRDRLQRDVKHHGTGRMFSGCDGGQLSSFSDSLASHDEAGQVHYSYQEHDEDSHLSSSNQDSPVDSLNNCLLDNQTNHDVGKVLESGAGRLAKRTLHCQM